MVERVEHLTIFGTPRITTPDAAKSGIQPSEEKPRTPDPNNLDDWFAPAADIFDTRTDEQFAVPLLKKLLQEAQQGKEPEHDGIEITISNLENILPFIYGKLGILDTRFVRKPDSQKRDESIAIGTKLHVLDMLCSVFLQQAKNIPVETTLPCYKSEKNDIFIQLLQSVPIPQEMNEESMTESLLQLWRTFHSLDTHIMAPKTLPLFPDDPVTLNRETILDAWNSDAIFTRGCDLIQTWVQGCTFGEPETWEMDPQKLTHREVQVRTNVRYPRITLVAKFDSISYIPKGIRTELRSSASDQKMGPRINKDPMKHEIEKRQAQIMAVIANEFTHYYIAYNDLYYTGKPYIMPYEEKDRFDKYNRFNPRTTKFTYRYFTENYWMKHTKVRIDEESYHEFFEWLRWFADAVYTYADEIRRLKKTPRRKGPEESICFL